MYSKIISVAEFRDEVSVALRKHGASDEIVEEFRKKYLSVAEENAQQRLHLTAFGVGLLVFCAGFGACYLMFVR